MSTGTDTKRCFIFLALFFLTVISVVHAEEDDDDQDDKNWMVMVGAVADYSPEFVGSDEYQWGAFPLLIARYEWPRVCAYIEGDELGFEASPFKDLPLSFAAGISLGESREEDSDPVLEGMGDISNVVQGFGEVFYGPQWLSAHARLRYAPLQRDSESIRHAFLSDIYLESEIEVIPLILRGEAGVTLMDATWSSLYYDEGSGIETAYVSLDAMVMLAQHFGIYLQGGVTRLLGEAASSAVSIDDMQYTAMLGAFVMF